MKLNEDKCPLRIFNHKFEAVWAKIADTQIWESREQKLLGVVTENDLNFDKFIITLWKKARKKLSALARLSIFLNLTQRKILMETFINYQFRYCPLT